MIRVIKMGLTDLHDSYGSWHLYICRSLYGSTTVFVASLLFICLYEGHFILCYKEDFPVELSR